MGNCCRKQKPHRKTTPSASPSAGSTSAPAVPTFAPAVPTSAPAVPTPAPAVPTPASAVPTYASAVPTYASAVSESDPSVSISAPSSYAVSAASASNPSGAQDPNPNVAQALSAANSAQDPNPNLGQALSAAHSNGAQDPNPNVAQALSAAQDPNPNLAANSNGTQDPNPNIAQALSAANSNGARDLPELPDHIINYEILPRVSDDRALLRFKCTSKYWHATISDPEFLSDYQKRQLDEALIHANRAPIPANDGEPEFQQPDGHVMYVYRRPIPGSGENPSIDRIHNFPGSESEVMNVVGITQNGVVCIVQGALAQDFSLWNPTTRSVLNIPVADSPDPGSLIGASAGFGFDRSRNEFAIIRIVRLREETKLYCDVAQRFNFQNGLWDFVENSHDKQLQFWITGETCDAVVNDVPYWKVKTIFKNGLEEEFQLKLVWFDPSGRVFNLEELPEWSKTPASVLIGEIRAGYVGALVWGKVNDEDPDIEVWMRTNENGEWIRTYRIDEQSMPMGGRSIAFFGDSEIVVELPTGLLEMMRIVRIVGADDQGADDQGANDQGADDQGANDQGANDQGADDQGANDQRGMLVDVDNCHLDGALVRSCKAMLRNKKGLTGMPRIGD